MSKKMITFCDVNGLEHDFPIDSVDYGTCSTQGSVVVKEVVCEGFSLYEGALIVVKFSYANTQYSIMMNVNGTGGKTVYFPGTSSMSTTATGHIQANGCYLFVYDGTYWRFCGSSNRLNYGLTLSLNGSSSTFNGSSAVSKSWYAPTTAGTKGQVLKSNGSGAPTWGDAEEPISDAIIIAASDASDRIKERADYVCDGITDTTIINGVMASLSPEGGTVFLTGGTFYITGTPLTLPSTHNVILRGGGNATVLKRMFNTNSPNDHLSVIKASREGSTIKDLSIDGNSSEYTYSYNECIYANYKTNIQNVKCYNSPYGVDCRDSNVINCAFEDIASVGVHANGSSIVIGNYTEGSIYINGDNSMCIGNYISHSNGILGSGDRSIISSNIIIGGGIQSQGDFRVISNNYIYNATSNGIYCVVVNGNNIIGNVILRGNGASSDYTSSQHTIHLSNGTTNCLVANNLIPGKNYTNNGGSTNTFVNNKYN